MTITKAPRPEVVPGLIIKAPTGCGNMYVQLGFVNGKLFEVFATLGRAGGCAMAFSEGLTRSITTGIRCGVPIAEYIDQLQGIRCPIPVPFPKNKAAMSCADAIARILTQFGSIGTSELIEIVKGFSPTPSDTVLSQEPNAHSQEDLELKEAVVRMEELAKQREKIGD